MPIEIVHALGLIKRAAAEVNRDLGSLDAAPRRRDRQSRRRTSPTANWTINFPLVVWQTGSGTQTNMNVNEVIANAANRRARRRARREKADPSERSRQHEPVVERFGPDARCTSPRCWRSHQRLLPALAHLHEALDAKAKEFAKIVKIGRTHTMDATPMTLGQEFSGYAAQVKSALARIRLAQRELYPAGARRHRGRHRAQCQAAIRQGFRPPHRAAHQAALRQRAEQIRAHGRARRLCVRARRAQRRRRRAVQDRQRHPPARLRPALGPRRT